MVVYHLAVLCGRARRPDLALIEDMQQSEEAKLYLRTAISY